MKLINIFFISLIIVSCSNKQNDLPPPSIKETIEKGDYKFIKKETSKHRLIGNWTLFKQTEGDSTYIENNINISFSPDSFIIKNESSPVVFIGPWIFVNDTLTLKSGKNKTVAFVKVLKKDTLIYSYPFASDTLTSYFEKK